MIVSASLVALLAVAVPTGGPLVPVLPERQSPPSEAATATAEAAYAEVQEAFAARRWAAAADAAERAYGAVPNASTALIRAVVYGAAGDDRLAFEAALQAADLDPTAAERDQVEQALARHGAAIGYGWLRVQVETEGAALDAGGVRWQGARTVGLPAGISRVEVSAPAHLTTEVEVTSVAGAGSERTLTLEPTPVMPSGRDSAGSGDELAGWLLVGSGAAILVGAGVTTLLAHDAADEAAELSRPDLTVADDVRRKRYDAARSDAEDRELVAGVLYGVGAAAIIAGGLLLVLDGDDAAEEARAANRVAPYVIVGPGSVGIGLTIGSRLPAGPRSRGHSSIRQ